jgi:cytochrome c553
MAKLVVICASVVLALAQTSMALAQQGDAKAGEAKAQTCFACHGPAGQSTMANVPSLARQSAQFLQLQMILFREGLRDSAQMAPFMKPLKDGDIADLAAYFASRELAKPAGPRDDALFAQGQAISKRANCASCHGAGYVGQAQLPRLAAQREDYLFSTMKEYREDKRSGTDTNMNGIVRGMSDGDLKALAHYLANQ